MADAVGGLIFVAKDGIHMVTDGKAWEGALYIVAIGAFALIILPIVYFFLVVWFSTDSTLLRWIVGSLFPFLFAIHTTRGDAITTRTALTTMPFFLTFVQWSVMAISNAALVHRRLSTRPLWSATTIIFLATASVATCLVMIGADVLLIKM